MLFETSSSLSHTRLIHLRSHNLQQIQSIIKTSSRVALWLLWLDASRIFTLFNSSKAPTSSDRTGTSGLGGCFSCSFLRTGLRCRLDLRRGRSLFLR